MTFRARLALSLAVCALALMAISGGGAIAQEEAVPASDHTVIVVHVVRNGRPGEGSVTIRDDDGHEATCTADHSGECELVGIRAGRHVVVATGPDGAASRARAIMVPEDGKVSLIVQIAASSDD